MLFNTDCLQISSLDDARQKFTAGLESNGFDFSTEKGLEAIHTTSAYTLNRIRCQRNPKLETYKERLFIILKLSLCVLITAQIITRVIRYFKYRNSSSTPHPNSNDHTQSTTDSSTITKVIQIETNASDIADSCVLMFIGLIIWYKFDTTGSMLGSTKWQPSMDISHLDAMFVCIAGSFCIYTGLANVTPYPIPIATVATISSIVFLYHSMYTNWFTNFK